MTEGNDKHCPDEDADRKPRSSPPARRHVATTVVVVRDAASRAAGASPRRNTAARHRPPRDLHENGEYAPPPPSLDAYQAFVWLLKF